MGLERFLTARLQYRGIILNVLPGLILWSVPMFAADGLVIRSQEGTKENAPEEIENFLSRDCQVRGEAAYEFIERVLFGNEDPAGLRTKVGRGVPQVASYLAEALAFAEGKPKANENISQILNAGAKQLPGPIPESGEERVQSYAAFSKFLLEQIQDQDPVTKFYLVRLLSGIPFGSLAVPKIRELRPLFESFLSGPDLRLRALSAAYLTEDRHLNWEGLQRLVPILLEGLEHSDFSVRYMSINALAKGVNYVRQTSKDPTSPEPFPEFPELCFIPVDPPANRTSAVTKLRGWWDRERKRIAGGK